jgi:Ca2+-binding EF-hand superfamily protein
LIKEKTMRHERKLGLVVATAVAVLASLGMARAADTEQKVVAGEYRTKELLLLMDQDRNGKVSRQEFMRFMEAEFDRLDTNKDGELDVQELTGVRVRRSNPSNHK